MTQDDAAKSCSDNNDLELLRYVILLRCYIDDEENDSKESKKRNEPKEQKEPREWEESKEPKA